MRTDKFGDFLFYICGNLTSRDSVESCPICVQWDLKMAGKRNILLTGFNAFGGMSLNSSQLVVERISSIFKDREQFIGEVLPTEYVAAEMRIRFLLERHRPSVCICTGLNNGADAVMLERVAVNLDDAHIADNAGEHRRSQTIIPGRPPQYESTLPIERIRAVLEHHRIPVRVSDSAGTFVCNHLFYVVAQCVESMNLNCAYGFIHLPHAEESGPGKAGISLAELTTAIQLCIDVCEMDGQGHSDR